MTTSSEQKITLNVIGTSATCNVICSSTGCHNLSLECANATFCDIKLTCTNAEWDPINCVNTSTVGLYYNYSLFTSIVNNTIHSTFGSLLESSQILESILTTIPKNMDTFHPQMVGFNNTYASFSSMSNSLNTCLQDTTQSIVCDNFMDNQCYQSPGLYTFAIAAIRGILCCGGKESCAEADIARLQAPAKNNTAIRCDGHDSCYNFHQIFVEHSIYPGDVYFTGYEAYRDKYVLGTETNADLWDIYCTGHDSCLNFWLTNGNNLYCTGDNSCDVSETVWNFNNIYMYGLAASNTMTLRKIRGNIYCSTQNSCNGNSIYNSYGSVYITGKSSFTNGQIFNVSENIFSMQQNSLSNVLVSNVGNLFCYNSQSCQQMQIYDTRNIIAVANDSLSDVNITTPISAEYAYTLLIGAGKITNTRFYCHTGTDCYIDCQQQQSCRELYLGCLGHCYVRCGNSTSNTDGDDITTYVHVDCPKVVFGTFINVERLTFTTTITATVNTTASPSVHPSKIPTELTTPSASVSSNLPTTVPIPQPTTQPTLQPTRQPTSHPGASTSTEPIVTQSIFPTDPLSTETSNGVGPAVVVPNFGIDLNFQRNESLSSSSHLKNNSETRILIDEIAHRIDISNESLIGVNVNDSFVAINFIVDLSINGLRKDVIENETNLNNMIQKLDTTTTNNVLKVFNVSFSEWIDVIVHVLGIKNVSKSSRLQLRRRLLNFNESLSVQIDTIIISDDENDVIESNKKNETILVENIQSSVVNIANITSIIFGTSIGDIELNNVTVTVIILSIDDIIISDDNDNNNNNIEDDDDNKKNSNPDLITPESIALFAMIGVMLCCVACCLFCCIVFCCRKEKEKTNANEDHLHMVKTVTTEVETEAPIRSRTNSSIDNEKNNDNNNHDHETNSVSDLKYIAN